MKGGHKPKRISEMSVLWVMLDLKERGYRVFRVIDQAEPSHFIIQPGNRTVVVRTARRLKDGSLFTHPVKGRYSVLAKTLMEDGERKIYYEPELDLIK
jgi:hypothetical protein